MRIAINTRFLIASKMEGFGWYTYEVSKRLVEQHPEHEFFFFFDRSFDPKFVFAKNVTPVVLRPPARHPILFYIWFEWSVKRALKKHKIDVFLSPDGYVSLSSNIPQIAVIHDLNFEHYPKDIPWQPRWYLKHFFPKFARKAKHIITVSEYSKQDISTIYSIDKEKITVGWNGASDAFKPLQEVEKESTRSQYSQSRPYFIFVGALHPRKNIPRLITAFQQFSQSNSEIDLLIVGENLWKNNRLTFPDLNEATRKRIHFTGHVPLERLTQLMGSAFALVYIPYFEGFGIPLAEAMKCGIPIICGDRTSLPEIAGDAALYCNPFSIDDITEKLLVLTNEPQTHKQLAQLSLERGQLFSWNNTAETVWKVLESTIRYS